MFSGARNIMFCGSVSSQHFCDFNGVYEVFLWGGFANSMCSDHFRQFFFDLLTDYSINLGHEICDNAFYCSHVSFVAAKVLSCGRCLSGLEDKGNGRTKTPATWAESMRCTIKS